MTDKAVRRVNLDDWEPTAVGEVAEVFFSSEMEKDEDDYYLVPVEVWERAMREFKCTCLAFGDTCSKCQFLAEIEEVE